MFFKKVVHFNDNRPEYKNIMITNLRDNIAYIFDGNKFIAQNKDIILNVEDINKNKKL